jgi:thioredoxin-like negative regulator of GroEL
VSLSVSAPVRAIEQVDPADPKLAAATELAKLLNESGKIEEQVDRLLAGIAQQAFTADPNLADMNKEYPGTD